MAGLAALALCLGSARGDAALTGPIDSQQLLKLDFGKRSHWLQPWRAYLDTFSAQRFTGAVGVNFNVSQREAPATARLLAANGFRRARIEVAWNSVSYTDPPSLTTLSLLTAKLQALKANGIRPLILLNSNDNSPGPKLQVSLNVVAPAKAGDRQVKLDAASAANVVLGRTGLDAPTGNRVAASFIITALNPSTNVATLSKPLAADLAVGVYKGTTLKYAPFAGPFLADGATPNPAFEDTLAGWLSYARLVTQTAKGILGGEGFDVEVWNELTFGSAYLSLNNYYKPLPAWAGTGEVTRALLARTVAYLRNPANGAPTIGIGNGFANTRPWDAGSTSPVGLTAIDKHPYSGMIHFPAGQVFNTDRPTDATGRPEGVMDASGNWHDSFLPTYDSFFPEYWLSGIRTDTLIRDLSPIATLINGVSHGRTTAPPGGTPPTVWLTEINQDPADGQSGLTPAQDARLQAKIELRTFVAYVNKGASAVYLYAAQGGKFGIVDPAFFTSVDNGVDPGTAAGGFTIDAVKRLTSAFQGATSDPIQPLSLVNVTDDGTHIQFAGQPGNTLIHPPLYDRDVLAFLPFQVSSVKYVIPVYVMTRNVVKLYNAALPVTDPTRFDMPPETMTLTIGGLPNAWSFSLYDPLLNTTAPVTVRSHTNDQYVLDVPVTDSPRLLTVTR